MAKYQLPFNENRLLRDILALLKQERDVRKGQLATLTRGKYAGYTARCTGAILHEGDEEFEFVYWFDIFRKDGKGTLSTWNNSAAREGRTKDEFEWI
jgi:hypothetical protein